MDTNPVLNKIKELLEGAEMTTEETAKQVLKGIGVDEVDKASNTGKKQPALPKSKSNSDAMETNEGTLPPWLKKGGKKKASEDEDEDEGGDNHTDKKSHNDDNDEDDGDDVEVNVNVDNDDEEDKEDKKKAKIKKEAFDVQAHMEALFANETSLTEDFKSKAVTIFEAALNERAEALYEEISEQYENYIAEELENNRLELAEQLDQYLDYVASEWIEENELAVENGIKNEITESFIAGLRDLFVNHGIEIPETEVDVVEELYNEIDALEEALNAEVQKNMDLCEAIEEQEKSASILSVGEDLNDTQFDKFSQLAESISYENTDDLTNKLKTIKESYFNKSSKSYKATVDDLTPDDADSGNGESQYVSESVQNLANSIAERYGSK